MSVSSKPTATFSRRMTSASLSLKVVIAILATTFLVSQVFILSVVFRTTNPSSPFASPSLSTSAATTQPSCLSIVYNKPPKTGSTSLRVYIHSWAKIVKRHVFHCGLNQFEGAVRLLDCIPKFPPPCSIFDSHIMLNSQVFAALQSRLGNFILMTSTRYPEHRILSNFMMLRKIKQSSKRIDVDSMFRDFLQNEFNPWKTFNYHTGDLRNGTCPLDLDEERLIDNLAFRYDVVIDVNLPEISNKILQYKKLFSLPPTLVKANVRGSTKVKLSEATKEALENSVCVERRLHHAMQLRMASLYEKATGKTCVLRGPHERLKVLSCITQMEQVALGLELTQTAENNTLASKIWQ